ncbi:hypothetical protein PHMEG_0004529 [Phytophthora megakarya]|uniref:Uncharacterized protein n=1 Tax=Phytophthora megakarya TaxID=4795 RepID=A0A225WTK9_9STRA|nr:hypothetical protein PHMEG_0004529 [Phytophthora megakarya]
MEVSDSRGASVKQDNRGRIKNLRCASFPAPRTQVKGEYYPPQTHQLAANRIFKVLSTPGAHTSAMPFVKQFRELECVRFEISPAVLMALYSGRLGNRGLTILHFKPLTEMEQLRRGSTNANISSDFGAAVALPASTPQCETYEELVSAISGLTSFGDALFFEHIRRLVSRLKRFVLANMERGSNTPEGVTLTLLFANHYLGRAMAHLCARSITTGHSGSRLLMAWRFVWTGARTSMSGPPAHHAPRNAPQTHLWAPTGRVPVMPESIHRQIPRDADGREPCLRYWAVTCATVAVPTTALTLDALTRGSAVCSAIYKTLLIATTAPTPVQVTVPLTAPRN